MAISNSGWSDDRFMDAYDAVWAIWSEHKTDEDNLPELRDLLIEIEETDALFAGILHDRRAA